MALIPVREAQDRLIGSLTPLGTERVALADATGRLLAEGLSAKRTQPPFDASAMDGFAVRFADVENLPVTLKVVDEIPAGKMPSREVGPGEAARLYTGSPVPPGADTVVIQEHTTYPDDLSEVTVGEITGQGAHIRAAGNDFREGDVLLRAGTSLDARSITLAAAMNCEEVTVAKRPRVAIISSGDELVPVGADPGPSQIIASNGIGLSAWLANRGAEPNDLGIVPDDVSALATALSKAAQDCDLILTIGGASVGDHDHVGAAVEKAGGSIDFWRIRMKPGKPVMVGAVSGTPLIGLPGNPASAFVGAEVFVRPALNVLGGVPDPIPSPIKVRLAGDLPATGDRDEFIRARLEPGDDGVLLAHPFARQDSSLMTVLAGAGALLVRAADQGPLETGALVEALLLD
jgi:molybdopterin molybdotransferase